VPVFEWKKLAAMLLAALITFLGETLGLSGEQITWLIVTLIGFLLGQGIADFGKGKEIARIKAAAKGMKLD